MTPTARTQDSMFLVLPVPFRQSQGELFLEAQAANGMDRWADNFDHVTIAAPLIPESMLGSLAGVRWVPATSLKHRGKVDLQVLPWAYGIKQFLHDYKLTRSKLRTNIENASHLQFAIGGLVGDWAAVAALEAARKGRRYAIHTDRVEHEVMRKASTGEPLVRRLKLAVEAPLVERYHRRVIRGASLGLWHGEECFRAYSPWCRENHLIHDVHTTTSDLIGDDALARKLSDVEHSPTLKVCYTGRLDPMKAPLDWLRAIATARDMGATIEATWYGEGALLEQAKHESTRLKLDQTVQFAGFVSDRAELLARVREAHVLLFTHITPESPRNLIEALVCGTPIVGYDSAYPEQLLEGRGGGWLSPMHDAPALGRLLARLASNRAELVTGTSEAAANGRRFSDAAVFALRSDLIKRFA